MLPPIKSKVHVRNESREFWKEFLASSEVASLHQAFCQFLSIQTERKKTSRCLAYHPVRSEFNVLKDLEASGWDVALPLVGQGFSLTFHLYLEAGEQILNLEPGAYGLMEPPATAPQMVPRKSDVIIVPTMAVNTEGYRLGKGGGFYDRLMDHEPYASMEKWAILPEKLLDAPFPAEPHDLRLNKIITEERIVTYP